ncbi:hypothetical protein QFZ94_008869 [Paraburkholderia sp. JPY465]|uniref:hypothetical protein n=1 Tax=Paraburkholderia sp. JPY465 TaxID=3042285 RepID=UPI003D1D2048
MLALAGGARVDMTGGSITTTGQSGAGLIARETGQVRTSGTPINTSGQTGYGAYAYAYAYSAERISMTGGSVTTIGRSGRGLTVTDANSLLSATDVPVQTAGLYGYGAYAGNGSVLDVTRGSFNTTGDSAIGVVAVGSNTSATLNGTTIGTSGTGSEGIDVENGATLTASNVTARATGASSAALYMGDNTGGGARVSFTGGSVTSAAVPTVTIASGLSHLSLTDTTVHGDALWLRVAATDAYSALARTRVTPGVQPSADAAAGPEEAEATVPLAPDVESVSDSTTGGQATRWAMRCNTRSASTARIRRGSRSMGACRTSSRSVAAGSGVGSSMAGRGTCSSYLLDFRFIPLDQRRLGGGRQQ